MFGFFKKKEAKKEETKTPVTSVSIEGTLFSPANGKVIAISEVSDPVFGEKMMGDGYAVVPTDGKIYAPVNGKVTSVFPTKHAIGLLMDNGTEVLLHMGLDTVELKGAPFEIAVTEGQVVTPETLVATVDLDALATAGKDNAMVVVITNMDKIASFAVTELGETTASKAIGTFTTKG
ncbi:PTS glucose transporter subunit IIA [Carnobacterium maltaromaticum]|uniref:PTS sugar transporter subunit IIA n=1 Tax=Carnobacterium maltaromaticum TaxID=2751 RepID=UPI00295F46EE|nr:PTS glucose transporter subunit IIA [Carnobacterium maltaromaticum]